MVTTERKLRYRAALTSAQLSKRKFNPMRIESKKKTSELKESSNAKNITMGESEWVPFESTFRCSDASEFESSAAKTPLKQHKSHKSTDTIDTVTSDESDSQESDAYNDMDPEISFLEDDQSEDDESIEPEGQLVHPVVTRANVKEVAIEPRGQVVDPVIKRETILKGVALLESNPSLMSFIETLDRNEGSVLANSTDVTNRQEQGSDSNHNVETRGNRGVNTTDGHRKASQISANSSTMTTNHVGVHDIKSPARARAWKIVEDRTKRIEERRARMEKFNLERQAKLKEETEDAEQQTAPDHQMPKQDKEADDDESVDKSLAGVVIKVETDDSIEAYHKPTLTADDTDHRPFDESDGEESLGSDDSSTYSLSSDDSSYVDPIGVLKDFIARPVTVAPRGY